LLGAARGSTPRDAASALAALSAARRLVPDLERGELALIEAARDDGAAWFQISAALGTRNRQTAQKRRPRPPLPASTISGRPAGTARTRHPGRRAGMPAAGGEPAGRQGRSRRRRAAPGANAAPAGSRGRLPHARSTTGGEMKALLIPADGLPREADLPAGGGTRFMRSLRKLIGTECAERIWITDRWEAWLDEDSAAVGKPVNQAATLLAQSFGFRLDLRGTVVIIGLDKEPDRPVSLSPAQIDVILQRTSAPAT
ncbi:MAG: DUF3846 domain-containing protein, partial [Trebonia sp.]